MRLSVGKDASDATARRLQKEAELNAMNNGLEIVPENGTGTNRSQRRSLSSSRKQSSLKSQDAGGVPTALGYFRNLAASSISTTSNAETC